MVECENILQEKTYIFLGMGTRTSWRDVFPTGRWRIENKGDTCTLYLECSSEESFKIKTWIESDELRTYEVYTNTCGE